MVSPEPYRLPGVGRVPLRDKHNVIVAWTTVDLDDLCRVLAISWTRTKNGYVHGYIAGSPGRKETLHRYLLGLRPGDGIHTDHKDRNRLNNRRSNLRATTQAANNQNTSGWAKSSSRFRGVNRARSGRWIASATVNYERFHLGTFDTEEEADQAAAAFRLRAMPDSIEALKSSAP